jgi:hypothetical protein
MKRLVCLAALTLAVITTPAFSQSSTRIPRDLSFASDFQTVPVVANNPGQSGTFQSYVALFNPTSSAYSVTASLYDVTGTKRTALIPWAAGELKTYTNFLDAVFNGFTGGGAVTFQSPDTAGGTRNNRFIVSTEVRTAGARYGTTVPVLDFAGMSSRSFAPGITVDSNTRTNLGCFGQTGVTTIVSGGYAQFDPTDSAVCYAVVVDNSTNDGRFISAAEYKP